jgi:hypothetical protein
MRARASSSVIDVLRPEKVADAADAVGGGVLVEVRDGCAAGREAVDELLGEAPDEHAESVTRPTMAAAYTPIRMKEAPMTRVPLPATL